MKNSLLLALAGTLALPALAQTPIPAPAGWKIQTKSNGATTFTPPDLKAGEKFSITVYDPAPLGSKTVAEYLRAFAGPVGKKAGQLAQPLIIQKDEEDFVRGTGIYVGPEGTVLGARFDSFSLDGAVHVLRIFTSNATLLDRYADLEKEVLGSLTRRAKKETGGNGGTSAGNADRPAQLEAGGALTPGVYVADQDSGKNWLHVYLYANGEYRICFFDGKDEDPREEGRYAYNRATGQIGISNRFDLEDDPAHDQSCYFGRDASGKATIVAFNRLSGTRVILRLAGPPTKWRSPSAQAIYLGSKAAPGRGVKDAQIAAIALDSRVSGTNEVNEHIYLLLKDGTIHADLPVAPDQLDAAVSRQHEPNKWGRWRKVGGGYQVSWAGKPFEQLPCDIMLPAPRGIRLSGRYSTGRSSGVIGMGGWYSLWGVTFSPDGRFSKDRSGGASSANIYGADGITPGTSTTYDDNGSSVVVGGPNVVGGVSQKSRNPKADREGAYFISGYTLTLRYDNGLVARWPFFFANPQHKTLWFEGATLSHKGNQ